MAKLKHPYDLIRHDVHGARHGTSGGTFSTLIAVGQMGVGQGFDQVGVRQLLRS
jgi:hypothetical protein